MAKIIHVLVPLLLLMAVTHLSEAVGEGVGVGVDVQPVPTIVNLNTLERFQTQQHHGYLLLQWYLNVCLMNTGMTQTTTCTPGNENYARYGFRQFHNNGQLLPGLTVQGYRYYKVGNLNEGPLLPHAVSRYYYEHQRRDIFNRDRLVMSYNARTNTVGEIYISDHYGAASTFRVGPNVITALRRLGPPTG